MARAPSTCQYKTARGLRRDLPVVMFAGGRNQPWLSYSTGSQSLWEFRQYAGVSCWKVTLEDAKFSCPPDCCWGGESMWCGICWGEKSLSGTCSSTSIQVRYRYSTVLYEHKWTADVIWSMCYDVMWSLISTRVSVLALAKLNYSSRINSPSREGASWHLISSLPFSLQLLTTNKSIPFRSRGLLCVCARTVRYCMRLQILCLSFTFSHYFSFFHNPLARVRYGTFISLSTSHTFSSWIVIPLNSRPPCLSWHFVAAMCRPRSIFVPCLKHLHFCFSSSLMGKGKHF